MPTSWCVDWKKNGTCPKPDCAKQHYIPHASQRMLFKTRLCKDGLQCKLWQCIHAHYPDELRCRVYGETRRCDDKNCRYLHIGRVSDDDPNVVDEDAKCDTEGVRPTTGGTVQYARPLRLYKSRALVGVARCKAEAKQFFEPPKKIVAEMVTAKKEGDMPRLFRTQLEIEEAQMHHDIRSYDLEKTTIKRSGGNGNYLVPCPGLAEQRPSVLVGDAVIVRDLTTNRRHKGYVNHVRREEVQCHFNYNFTDKHPVHVIFTAPRGPLLLQYRAVESAPFYLTPKLLHPSTVPSPLLEGDRQQVLKHLQRAGCWDRLDDSQQEFVSQFFRARSVVSMLHGPPGTGKTTTVVAVLLALRALMPLLPNGFRVLVCTPSNKSADLIAERMVEGTPAKERPTLRRQLLRMNALSRTDAPKELAPYSNDQGVLPDLATLKSKQFVVSTLCTSGKVYGIGDGDFDLLVVDEAGQCTEQELLVAMCNVRSDIAMGRVVLAGDHKQLGPVIRSKYCRESGMARSPLQRMQESASVAACATMLRHNYRAHPDIVSLYNPTYGGQLIASATGQPKTTRFHGTFPFEHSAAMAMHVDGTESQDPDSPSWRNDAEAMAVADLIANVMSQSKAKPADIVVLSGYAKQCAVLRDVLNKRFQTAAPGGIWDIGSAYKGKCPIEVCSVEKFQGREAPIVIMSTVRSRDLAAVQRDMYVGLGFISNRQRVNVGISRPEGGLCIVGNLELLACDEEWARIIKQIGAMNGIYRETPAEFKPMKWDDVEFGARMLKKTVHDNIKRNQVPPGSEGEGGVETEWHRRE